MEKGAGTEGENPEGENRVIWTGVTQQSGLLAERVRETLREGRDQALREREGERKRERERPDSQRGRERERGRERKRDRERAREIGRAHV